MRGPCLKDFVQSSSGQHNARPQGHFLHQSLRSAVSLRRIGQRCLERDYFDGLQHGDNISFVLSCTVQSNLLYSEAMNSLLPFHILAYSLVFFTPIEQYVDVRVGCVVIDDFKSMRLVPKRLGHHCP